MKKILLIIAYLLPMAGMAQNNFKISGKVAELHAPARAYLYYARGREQITDSVDLREGKFDFSGNVNDPQQAAIEVIINPATADRRASGDVLPFYLEARTLEIVSATDSVKYALVKGGSKLNDDFGKLNAMLQPATDQNALISAEWKHRTPEERKDPAYIKSSRDRSNEIQQERTAINKRFYLANPDSYIGLIAYRNTTNIEGDPYAAEALFNTFSDAVKATDLGKSIVQNIAAAKKTAIGQAAMDFIQNDLNGKPVKLSDFRGKFVLIDFWASWCVPCRGENPNVLKAYNMYKDQNFTIISISLDSPGKKADWEAAVKKDGLTWTNVSDLKGRENEAAREYGIQSIPANYLIDPAGKIIAKNLRGNALLQKLAEVLVARQ